MSESPGVDEVLWSAEGMAHEISLTESLRGMAIMAISGLKGGRRESATLLPSERYALAKALYPAAFDEAHPFTSKEYTARDRSGRNILDGMKNRHLIELSMNDEEDTLLERDVTAWREVEE